MNREMEFAHLCLADRLIAEGEARISTQIALVKRLRAAGHPIGPAEDLLHLLSDTLVQWNRHRSLIIASLNEGSPASGFAQS